MNPLKLPEDKFSYVYKLIEQARSKVWKQVNKSLVELYWDIGQYIHERALTEGWGKSTVQQLSDYILTKDSSVQGFSARNLWRMKLFYETYKDNSKLSAMLTEISWSNHLHILSKTKNLSEKEFYLNLAAKTRYTEREFGRIIDSCTFERTTLADKKLSATLTEFPMNSKGIFKDSYVFEFLNLPEQHKEKDLQKALVANLKQFLLELGPDFSLIKEEFPLQVGMRDFKIDILLHNRSLNNLIAIELKIDEFQPEYLGKLQFYLEALDRNVKKPHENPSIGILICKSKDEEVVEFALSRSTSPAMIAEYETKLINKEALIKKLHELSLELEDLENESTFIIK